MVDRRFFLGGLSALLLMLRAKTVHAQTVTWDLSHLSPEQRARAEAVYARMMAALAFPRVTVAGAQALAEWERRKAASGGLPIVIGSDEDLERIANQFSIDDAHVTGVKPPGDGPRTTSAILDAAAKIKFPNDLRKWPGAYQPSDLHAPLGDWPSEVKSDDATDLTIARDLSSGQFHDHVHLLLLPAKGSWEVPAYLRWGNWNACPPPEYHVAALRRWNENYGAELVAINGDTMNLRVAHRPKTRSEALALAREHYGYCPDIVDQGVESISALAATLMASDWWFFWWD